MSSSPPARSRLTRANDLAVELAVWEMENKRRRIVSCREWAAGGWDAWRIVRNLHAAQCIFAWGTLCRRGPRRFEVPSLHMARLRRSARHGRLARLRYAARLGRLARLRYTPRLRRSPRLGRSARLRRSPRLRCKAWLGSVLHAPYPAWSTCFCTSAVSSFLLCTSSLA